MSGQVLVDAAKRGDLSRVGALLERGVQINSKDLFGETALHRAAWKGHLEVARLLLDRGADNDIKTPGGWTALHQAAIGGRLGVARLLIDRSANIDIKDNDGKTAMDWARERGHSAIVALIEEKGRMSSEERRASETDRKIAEENARAAEAEKLAEERRRAVEATRYAEEKALEESEKQQKLAEEAEAEETARMAKTEKIFGIPPHIFARYTSLAKNIEIFQSRQKEETLNSELAEAKDSRNRLLYKELKEKLATLTALLSTAPVIDKYELIFTLKTFIEENKKKVCDFYWEAENDSLLGKAEDTFASLEATLSSLTAVRVNDSEITSSANVAEIDTSQIASQGETTVDLAREEGILKVENSLAQASIAVLLPTTSRPSAVFSFARAFFPVEDGKYHVFLTHTWNMDNKGRDSHLRVGRVNAYLQSRGIACWFDSERMQGSIRRLMTQGIDDSMAMIVFLQRTYIDKVNGDEERDNCRYEFTYAVEQKGPQNMLPVVMEETIRNPRDWKKEVGAALGTKLYVDFSSDEFDSDSDFFTAKCEELIQQLKSLPALRPYLL